MIGYLSGIIKQIEVRELLLDVNGVGYRVNTSKSNQLILGDKIELWIYPYIREDRFELYGFTDKSQQKLFENLLEVSGVGPKMALALLNIGTPSEIIIAIRDGNTSLLTSIPGVGPKLARKIIVELADKLGSLDVDAALSHSSSSLVEALKQFGFSPQEIGEAIQKIPSDIDQDDERLKFALKQLGK